MLHAQNGKGLIHIVLAKVLYALGMSARYKHKERVPIADLENGRFDPLADYTDLMSALQNSGVPVADLRTIISQLCKREGMRCPWREANTPTGELPDAALPQQCQACALPGMHGCFHLQAYAKHALPQLTTPQCSCSAAVFAVSGCTSILICLKALDHLDIQPVMSMPEHAPQSTKQTLCPSPRHVLR